MMMSSQRTRISTLLSLLWLLQLVTRHNAMTIKDDVVPSQVRSLANNNYNNYNNNYYRQANQQQYQNTDDDYMPALTICDDLIIQVTSIQTVCDSPATYYWGSGVNRNSLTCNFGDKATTTISFDVTESLYDTNIYVVMSMYAGYGNEVLTSTTPKNIKKYVGYSCNEAGSYSYTYSTTVGSAYSSSGKNYGSFIPFIQVAFSSDKNGDYNLGAANIPCQWDNREFGEWTEVTAQRHKWTSQDFLMEYGILIGAVVLCFIFVGIMARVTQNRHRQVKEYFNHRQRMADEKAHALMRQVNSMPLDNSVA